MQRIAIGSDRPRAEGAGHLLHRLLAALCVATLLLAGGGPVMAQGPRVDVAPSGSTQGTSSSPTTVDRDRSDRVAPALPAPPPIATPRPSITVAPTPDARPGVLLGQVKLPGSSLSPAAIDGAVSRFVGQAITPAMLKELADAVGRAYAQSDFAYYAVMIPPQTLDSGTLIVRVTEGYVKEYTIAGATASTPTRLIQAHIGRIMSSVPLRKSVLERALSLMRDIPGQTVTASVRQLDASGALALDLTVRAKQVEINLKIDNDGISNITTAFQAQVGVTVNGLLREGDRTTLTGYLPLHPNRYQYYSASHSTPIGTNGMTLSLNGSTISTSTADSSLEGRATLAGVSLSYPLIRGYKKNLSLTASFDGVDSRNYYLDTKFGDYHARAIRAGATYSNSDDKKGYALSAIASRGVDILGARAFTGYSETVFTKGNVQAVAVKTFGKNLTAKATFYGQYSRDKLPVTERMALGGRGTGRAFNAGTVTGDRGVAGQIELDWKLPKAPALVKGSSLFAFVDGGSVRSVARPVYRLPGQSLTLVSAGAGVRVAILQKWRASVEVALPVKRPASFYSRAARLFFGLGRAF